MSQPAAPQSSEAQFFGHPRGLMTLFFTEMWERFTYYGMRALLILFMTAAIKDGGFGFGAETAGPVYAMYVSLAYLATVPGGWIADNFLGQRRSVLYGGIMIMLGNGLLIFHGLPNFFCGLACIVVGVGMLKPNISVIVGQLYTKEDARRDSGFSIFYMGINLGALLAPLVCGWLAQSDKFRSMLEGWGIDPASAWHWGFGAAAVGMGLGLVQYVLTSKQLGDAGLYPTKPANDAVARKNRRTLQIGIASVAALAIALFAFDSTSKHFDAIKWEARDGGLVIEASAASGGPTTMKLNEGAALEPGALADALGADTLAAMQREVFHQRVAAGKAKGAAADVFLRVREEAAAAAQSAALPGAGAQSAAAAAYKAAPEVRINGVRWEDVPGGVLVYGARVEDPKSEVKLGELRADTIDGKHPDQLAEAVGPVLKSVLNDAVKSGATTGSLSKVHVKVGGLNRSNIQTGFSISLLAIVVFFFVRLFMAGEWTPSERARLITICVLFCGAAIFWGIFEQAGSTLTLFADRSTHNSVLSFSFPSSWWQSVNAILIVLLAPAFAWLWLRMGKHDPSYPAKFSVGLLFAGLGFALLVGGAALAKGGHEVSPLWLLGVYLLHTIGELCLSPVGLSSMTKLAPARVVSLMMGVWFLAASIGNFIGGSVAGFYEKFELPTLFAMVAASGFVMALVMFALVIPIKRMMARNEEAVAPAPPNPTPVAVPAKGKAR